MYHVGFLLVLLVKAAVLNCFSAISPRRMISPVRHRLFGQ